MPPFPRIRSAHEVRRPSGEPPYGPYQAAWSPVAIRIDGVWRIGLLRTWCQVPGGWHALIETAGPDTGHTAWYLVEPDTIRPLHITEDDGAVTVRSL